MDIRPRFVIATEIICLLILVAAFIAIQVLIGGTRMVFNLPSFAAVALAGIVSVFAIRRDKPVPSQLCLIAAAVFFSYILLRAWLSPVPYIARTDIYSVLAGLVVYFVTAYVLTSAQQRLAFISCLLVAAVAHVLVGVLQFRDASNFMPIPWLQRFDYGARASGFYVCPNHLAGLLEVLGIFGASMVCWSRWPVWAKLLVGYAVGVCYVGIILTGSRGGYLSTAASLFVFAVLSVAVLRHTTGGLFWKVTAAGVLAALIAGLAVVYGVGKSAALSSRAHNTFEMSNVRFELWDAALQQWKVSPLLGTGSATYLYYGRLFRAESMQRDPVYVHNDYLQLLSEYGLIGFAGMLLFVGVHLWRGTHNFRRLGPKRVAVSPRLLSNALALNIGALAAVASYVVHSALDFNLHIPANLLLMAFVFGILANDGIARQSDAARVQHGFPFWRLVVPALGLFVLVQSARLFPGEYLAERSRAALRDDQPLAAAHLANRALAFDSENPDLHFYLGLARLANAERFSDLPEAAASFYREATLALERARSIAPQETIYALELAMALDAQQRFAEAEAVYYDALQLDPRSSSIRRYYDGHLELWKGVQPAESMPETPAQPASPAPAEPTES
jgi:O-antigen ligase